jgi:membrane dipeptidase
MTHAMPFPAVNAMGVLGNPNIALEAAKTGRLEQIGSGPVARIDARALSDAQRSGVAAVNVTLGHVVGPQEPYTLTRDEIRVWDEFLAKHPAHLLKVLCVEDVLTAHASGRVGVIYGFQNTEMLEGQAERVAEFSALGVRVMQLTYNGRNAVADGCMVPDDAGLSPLGRAMVAQMNAQRVLIDLSHSSEKTCLDAIRQSTVPVAITHSACRALANLPRNKSDAELRLLARRGGVIGIYAMPFLREQGQPFADDLLRHVEHAINICGEDHVGFGSDGSISAIDDMPTYMRYLAEDVAQRKQSGVGASGEDEAVALFLPDLCGPGQFQVLADHLQRRGHGSARIEKILGGNFLRLMRETWA